MPILENLSNAGIYVAMAVGLLAAVGVVTLRSLFHAALALAAVLLVTAILFISLHAEFIAMVQILIYVGAVMTLVIFAIMLTGRLGEKSIQQHNRQSWIALLAGATFLAFLLRIILETPWPVSTPLPETDVSVFELGQALLGPYVFPFEIVSVLLLAALIGAIVIARKDSES